MLFISKQNPNKFTEFRNLIGVILLKSIQMKNKY